MSLSKQYPCPCCDFLTRSEAEHGTYEICPVCGWDDDDTQFNNEQLAGGANKVCLREAKNNFNAFGAISNEKKSTVRKAKVDEYP